MDNNTRKIVVLDKLDSPQIEQAIFILRETGTSFCRSDAVSEAQRIVENYMHIISPEAAAKSRLPKKRGKFIMGMALYTTLTVVVTTYIMTMIR